MPSESLLLISLLILGVCAFFSLIIFLISIFSPWNRILKKYPRQHEPRGKKFSRETLGLGSTSYKECITVYASPDGLDLNVNAIFRGRSRPIFIPWTELHQTKAKKILWLNTVTAEIGSPSITSINFSEKSYQSYREAAGLSRNS